MEDVEELYVSKGTKTRHFDLKTERPDDKMLLQLMLGPTGNLRAPTVRVGRIVIVGFGVQAYQEAFGLI